MKILFEGVGCELYRLVLVINYISWCWQSIIAAGVFVQLLRQLVLAVIYELVFAVIYELVLAVNYTS